MVDRERVLTGPGMLLQSTGILLGTPSALGSFNFTARVTDSASAQATRAFTVTVTAPVSVGHFAGGFPPE